MSGEISIWLGLTGIGLFLLVDTLGDIAQAQADTKATVERALETNSQTLEDLSKQTKRLRLEFERIQRECRK